MAEPGPNDPDRGAVAGGPGGGSGPAPAASPGSPAAKADAAGTDGEGPAGSGSYRSAEAEAEAEAAAAPAPAPPPAPPAALAAAPAAAPGGGPEAEAGGRREAAEAGAPDLSLLRVKDLDTGKEYTLEKVYRIKDLDTGKEFIVDAEAGPDGGPGGGPAAVSQQSLVDVASGKQLTMNEFESSIGLGGDAGRPTSPVGDELARRARSSTAAGAPPGVPEGERGEEGPGGGKERFSSGGSGDEGKKGRIWKGLDSVRGAKGKGAEAGEGKPDLEEWLPGEPPGGLAKVSVNTKLYKEFTELRMVQELQAHQGAVWAMKFSQDGKYLASAGQDSIVRIWTLAPVLSPSTAGDKAKKPVQDFFEAEPYRLYVGHKADVLDLSWSKTQFLLSSSMDKTVRLWHISMEECLRVFNHSDFVTAVDFHPIDDKYFLSGSLDEKLRLWNIPDHTVRDWVNVHEMVTAACFSPDGKQAIVGSYKGKCRFYQTEGMKFEYVTQIDVKSTRGSSRGKKITGLEYMPGVDKLLLITSNDSRIRMYDGYTLKTKYKGHKNANSQIQATFSPGGGYVVCGSEDGGVFLWSTINTFIPSVNPYYTGYRKEKNSSYEAFRCGEAPASPGTPAPGPSVD